MSDDRSKRSKTGFRQDTTIEISTQFLRALSIDQAAKGAFDLLSAEKKREFNEWILEDKTPEGRARRATEALGKLRSGKQARE